MAASDRTYRNQRLLDIVFGVSCLLMLGGIVAMFAQDYYRPYKVEARDFRDVEAAVYERQMLDLVPDEQKRNDIVAAEKELKEARTDRAEQAKTKEGEQKGLVSQKARAEAKAQGLKADYDSKVSLYNIDIEKRDEAVGRKEHQALAEQAASRFRGVEGLKSELDTALGVVDAVNQKLEALRAQQKGADDRVSKAEQRLKTLTEEFDRFAKLAVKSQWTFGDRLRQFPVIDAFASPTKIQQTTLTDLPIDYNFKQVTRFDRCTTCHLGIERKAFDKESLRSLREEPAAEQRQKLQTAADMLASRRKTLGDTEGPRPKDVRLTRLSAKVLTDARINEYGAHPRLDLFVDGHSPHPSEKFGCTICHGGQGSATDFLLASHSPNDAAQMAHWERQWHWEANHFWDFPMLPQRFVESSCIKCHHQVTDLVSEEGAASFVAGKQHEGPGAKVLRGYNLLRENGCFGCHEIGGLKGGQWVGPDLRLEPPPDQLNPDGSPKGPVDPANPPGTFRKVGPNLARLAEKTNPTWAWNWIRAPRDFRPNTKMPHFYGLSNNDREALEKTGQQNFPETEIHAIVHYLFEESGKQLTSLTPSSRLPEPPPESKDLTEGRRLFTERGCLACHQHSSTTKALGKASGREGEPGYVPAVEGEAVFGPNLSRLAAKLGVDVKDPAKKKESARRWLTQWIQDPKLHHPRTFMPVTHLTRTEAGAVADWLLSQASDWAATPAPQLDKESLRAMARLYLEKSMTPEEAGRLLDSGGHAEGFEDWAGRHPGADESRLMGGDAQGWDDNLKWYVGKKAIGQLGCFGCHNIPGFENAKPIGTPLNDWGKKDPERLAFEDVVAYVEGHHQRVEHPADAKDIHGHEVEFRSDKEDVEGGARADPLKQHSRSYEEYFYDALAHHRRDGFLYQKLREPRSFDYNRLRSWEDRLRMPQFQFARGDAKPLQGESQEQALAREEAEAREAVMTFVLGLVADQVPSRFIYDASPDKKAEVRGRQVLDKFNCAGCHQLRTGLYAYDLRRSKPNPDQPSVLESLEQAFRRARDGSMMTDHRWEDHNAWVGLPQAQPDRLTAYAIPSEKDAALAGYALPRTRDEDALPIKLTRALRFTKRPQDVRDPEDAAELPAGTYHIPAAESLALRKSDLVIRADPHGGTFTELLVPYLVERKTPKLNDDANARSGLPPPLLREGEKTQPGWLFRFLRNPIKLREVAILRMPQFNMSDDEAMTLVNYFGAVDRLTNPSMGLTYPYLLVPQREEGYLTEQAAKYAHRIAEDGQKRRTFVGDAYGLLTVKPPRTICLNCHQVGNQAIERLGPRLDLAPERLRPDWTERWIASPGRLLIYPSGPHTMPQAFPANRPQYQDLFEGLSLAELPAPIRAAVEPSWKQLLAAQQVSAREQAEAALSRAYEQASLQFVRTAEARLRTARAAVAAEEDKERRTVLQVAVQDAEKGLDHARRAVGRYSLNQVQALRDILMNLPEVESKQGNAGAPAKADGGGH